MIKIYDHTFYQWNEDINILCETIKNPVGGFSQKTAPFDKYVLLSDVITLIDRLPHGLYLSSEEVTAILADRARLRAELGDSK